MVDCRSVKVESRIVQRPSLISYRSHNMRNLLKKCKTCIGILVNWSYQNDFAKRTTDQLRADHLGMKIASRDALVPTNDISCSLIW